MFLRLEGYMTVLEDVRYGLRTLAKNPGFTLVAVSALSLGIGVNATVFTLSNAVLFKNMPFDQNDRILYMSTRNANRGDRSRTWPVLSRTASTSAIRPGSRKCTLALA
jgi:hypothetical protein